jgi:hypothetical protein
MAQTMKMNLPLLLAVSCNLLPDKGSSIIGGWECHGSQDIIKTKYLPCHQILLLHPKIL